MFADANMYCKTCDVCQKIKIDYAHKMAPLHPHAVPETLGSRFAIDHKVLTRTTAQGNTAILVVVEVFSGFPHFIAVKDMTSLTTAKALVHHVLPLWGTEITLVSDKGPAFTSQIFKHISELLGIKHISSGARNPRSNGLAEAYVRRFAEYLKYYATDDYSIEETIPLIEILIRATPMSKLQLSPYQIVCGRKFPLAAPASPWTRTYSRRIACHISRGCRRS